MKIKFSNVWKVFNIILSALILCAVTVSLVLGAGLLSNLFYDKMINAHIPTITLALYNVTHVILLSAVAYGIILSVYSIYKTRDFDVFFNIFSDLNNLLLSILLFSTMLIGVGVVEMQPNTALQTLIIMLVVCVLAPFILIGFNAIKVYKNNMVTGA